MFAVKNSKKRRAAPSPASAIYDLRTDGGQPEIPKRGNVGIMGAPAVRLGCLYGPVNPYSLDLVQNLTSFE
jgi:hypothetical protein